MAEGWTKDWERRIVNGVYPLRRFLGRSNHSVVFLTEYKAQGIVPSRDQDPAGQSGADGGATGSLEDRGDTVASSLDPASRLGALPTRRAQFSVRRDGLCGTAPGPAASQPRADAPRGARPAAGTLDALAYLHGHNLVQGGLKPSNFLVVHDQLKLASDTVRPAGEGSGTPFHRCTTPRKPTTA